SKGNVLEEDSDGKKALPADDFYKNIKINKAPFEIPPLYSGVRFVVYAIFAKGVQDCKTIELTAYSHNGSMNFEVPVDPVKLEGSKFHTLAARKLIQDLEEHRSVLHNNTNGVRHSEVRKAIVSLGKFLQLPWFRYDN